MVSIQYSHKRMQAADVSLAALKLSRQNKATTSLPWTSQALASKSLSQPNYCEPEQDRCSLVPYSVAASKTSPPALEPELVGGGGVCLIGKPVCLPGYEACNSFVSGCVEDAGSTPAVSTNSPDAHSHQSNHSCIGESFREGFISFPRGGWASLLPSLTRPAFSLTHDREATRTIEVSDGCRFAPVST